MGLRAEAAAGAPTSGSEASKHGRAVRVQGANFQCTPEVGTGLHCGLASTLCLRTHTLCSAPHALQSPGGTPAPPWPAAPPAASTPRCRACGPGSWCAGPP